LKRFRDWPRDWPEVALTVIASLFGIWLGLRILDGLLALIHGTPR
jgi:hypothetical protein